MIEMPLKYKQDSTKFSEVTDDPSKTLVVDGGYEYSRPMYTRRPRKTWTTGFTNLTDDERKELSEFYDQVKGGASAFYWYHPILKKNILVRFKGTISFAYVGAGETYRWNTGSIVLREL